MNYRIKEVRRHFKKTQEEFGESLGASRNTITSYETGRVIPNKTFIQLLCTTYQVREEWLTNGEGSMIIESQEDVMERFAQENGLSYHVKKILEFYLSLDEEKQKAADELFQDFINSYNNEQAATLETVVSTAAETELNTELESQADAVAEFARQEFLKEKRRTPKASSSTNSTLKGMANG